MKTPDANCGEYSMNGAGYSERLVEAVMERLLSRRIGILWPGEAGEFAGVPGITWVHYARGACGARRYDPDTLARPDLEARTLDMLVVPGVSVPLLAELVSGLSHTSFGAMADGAIRRRIPVLFETSALRAYYAAANGRSRESLKRAVDSLRARGAEFLGFALAEAASVAGAVDLPSGWLAWRDIAHLVAGASEVRLSGASRLTPEARDRLRSMRIHIIEGC